MLGEAMWGSLMTSQASTGALSSLALLAPEMQLLPQDSPSRQATTASPGPWCRHRHTTALSSPLGPTCGSVLAGRAVSHNEPPCSPQPRAGLHGMAGNRLRFLVEFYYIHRINK